MSTSHASASPFPCAKTVKAARRGQTSKMAESRVPKCKNNRGTNPRHRAPWEQLWLKHLGENSCLPKSLTSAPGLVQVRTTPAPDDGRFIVWRLTEPKMGNAGRGGPAPERRWACDLRRSWKPVTPLRQLVRRINSPSKNAGLVARHGNQLAICCSTFAKLDIAARSADPQLSVRPRRRCGGFSFDNSCFRNS